MLKYTDIRRAPNILLGYAVSNLFLFVTCGCNWNSIKYLNRHVPRRIAGVGESHVAHAELVVCAQNAQRVGYGVPTLDADQ